MNQGTYVFAQLIKLIHWQSFARHVNRYKGNARVREFTCWHQFLCMSFGQLTHRESLRDLVTCLNAHQEKLYHLGLSHGVKRSTLADANESRDYRIYMDLGMSLIKKARKLYQDEPGQIELDNVVYALDSTTIELCLNVFWWARFRKHKAAVKLHTLFDVKCEIPCFIHISDGKFHDVNVLDILEFEPDAIYVIDRGYVDWERLYKLHQTGAYFVIRAKRNLAFERIYSRKVDKSTGLRCDQTVRLRGYKASKNYPEKLRRVKFYDGEHKVTYVYLTNHFEAEPMQIVVLYLNRWKVELFFKWIKQHLRIKSFFGTSENAVKSQIWIAISVYVLVAIIKKRLALDADLYTILQILSLTLFEKNSLHQMLTGSESKTAALGMPKQLNLLDNFPGQ